MDIETYAVSQAMYISVERDRSAQLCLVSFRLEILAGHALVINERGVEIEIFDHFVIDLADLIVKCLRFRRGIPQAPGAGEIVEISTALLHGKDVENDRFAQGHQLSRRADGMGKTG